MKIQIVSILLLAISTSFQSTVFAHSTGTKPVIMDLKIAKLFGIPSWHVDENLGVALTEIDPEMEMKLQKWSHANGKCGSFESLESFREAQTNPDQLFKKLRIQNQENQTYLSFPIRPTSLIWNQDVQNAINQVDENNIKSLVQWISAFPTRFNKSPSPNVAVEALYEKLKIMLQASKLPSQIDLMSHKSTPQKSIRVRLTGYDRPSEILVFGAHFDSISNPTSQAPGADDNASGSSNLIEALRIVLSLPQTERTLEFFWYAGEESGLLGSAEIAEDYQKKNIDVVSVLQLDMTMHPGEGEMVVGNVEDFTSAWLRDYFQSMATVYLNIKLVRDECGYGCSDHASWYRRGYSTLLPFEATTSTMNRLLHTTKDVINSKSSFKHSAAFAKIPIVMAMDLGNSTERKPMLNVTSSKSNR